MKWYKPLPRFRWMGIWWTYTSDAVMHHAYLSTKWCITGSWSANALPNKGGYITNVTVGRTGTSTSSSGASLTHISLNILQWLIVVLVMHHHESSRKWCITAAIRLWEEVMHHCQTRKASNALPWDLRARESDASRRLSNSERKWCITVRLVKQLMHYPESSNKWCSGYPTLRGSDASPWLSESGS